MPDLDQHQRGGEPDAEHGGREPGLLVEQHLEGQVDHRSALRRGRMGTRLDGDQPGDDRVGEPGDQGHQHRHRPGEANDPAATSSDRPGDPPGGRVGRHEERHRRVHRGHRRLDEARADGRHHDAPRPQRDPQALHVGVHGRLAGAVGRLARQALERGQAGDRQQMPATASEHARQDRLDRIDHPHDVDAEGLARRRRCSGGRAASACR